MGNKFDSGDYLSESHGLSDPVVEPKINSNLHGMQPMELQMPKPFVNVQEHLKQGLPLQDKHMSHEIQKPVSVDPLPKKVPVTPHILPHYPRALASIAKIVVIALIVNFILIVSLL
ncbi:MAG: hypothetical protein K2X66_00245 [Cyanobacteria bacterium]|nr:hypothetical protein [Cyanobacteriota bacterium]